MSNYYMDNDNNIISHLFDPEIYEIIIELENGSKDELYLETKLKISRNNIKKRLGYLINNDIVFTSSLPDDKTIYTLNKNKLSDLTSGEIFNEITDKLTTLNSFLN